MILIMSILFCITMIPEGTDAESKTATVRVEYEGYYTGTITADDDVQQVEGEWNMDFETEGDVIFVIMTKSGDDNKEMTVSILVDDEVRVSRSTSEPYGEVRLSYSLGAEENLDDDDGNETDEDGGVGCGSLVGITIISILTLAFLFARKK